MEKTLIVKDLHMPTKKRRGAARSMQIKPAIHV
jgi:hypothetical protein